MDAAILKQRTRDFAIRVIRLVRSLPRDVACDELGRQLLRCACSVAANYRAACRGRSKAEFIAKMGIVEEESDEAHFWMEVLIESQLVKAHRLHELMQEAHELTAIAVASIRTSRRKTK